MKKRYRALIYIGLILYVIGGFLLTAYTKNIIYIIIVFASFFVLAILATPLYIIRIRKEFKRQEKLSVDEAIEEINDKEGYNQLEYSVHQIKSVVDTWKLSSKADIIKGLLFLIFFIGCIVAFVIFMSMEKFVLGIVFFCLAVGEILCAFIVVKILETKAILPKKKEKLRNDIAVVLGTTISSQSSTGNRHHTIGDTTYKVFLKIGDQRFVTYSKEYYEIGDKLRVCINIKNAKKVYIVEKIKDIVDIEENF